MQDTMRKKLLWRATHRGIKEIDIVVGGYAAHNLATMDAATLEEFSRILDIPDQELLSWATRQEDVPADVASPLLDAVLGLTP
jgi:antitoxin CptB